ncbi:hypothetical protein MRB53_040184 [Persea americana]|nr:hypothetical protein MRB53_040184 [Persea americana]
MNKEKLQIDRATAATSTSLRHARSCYNDRLYVSALLRSFQDRGNFAVVIRDSAARDDENYTRSACIREVWLSSEDDQHSSLRDLSLPVPINFVPVAGVTLTAACFPNGTYETDSTANCVSNLLALGFRRYVLDVYWDDSRQDWSFCPVQLGNADSNTVATSYSTRHTTTASALTVRNEIEPRQTQTRSFTSVSTISSLFSSVGTPTTTTTLSKAVPSATPSGNGNGLIQVGPYRCQPSTNMALFMQVLTAYLDFTNNNLNATTTYVIINLHAAALPSNPTGPPPTPSKLPGSSGSISGLVTENATQYLYTPSNLIQQRSDLNGSGSWYDVPLNILPAPGYFDVTDTGYGDRSTNGWPSEVFIEFSKAKRLLVGFGTISPQMSEYNTGIDSANIFPQGDLSQEPQFSLSTDEQVTSGCLYQPYSLEVNSMNNSWAIAESISTSPQLYQAESSNLTWCGYSPILNQTLANSSAADSIEAYRDFVVGTVWSWAPDQPADASSSASNFHCAALNSTSGWWQVEACNNYHYGACRIGNSPYQWQSGSTMGTYGTVDQACGTNTSFTVSRTALENRHLLRTWRETRVNNSISDELLWLNFNDLDISTCWVVGQSTTCPYTEPDNEDHQLIVVPLVAGIIVLVVVVLTIFVKCAANRQNTRRRRRRGDDGWDYEGVPS